MKALVLFGLAAIAAAGAIAGAAQSAAPAPLPERLSATGLFVSGSTTRVRADVIEFAPQYPLWSDGTRKRRWIHLPPGTSIDASRPDQWQFPVGTRLWKEFGYGRRIETRYVERLADGSWRFAAYVWNADGTDALLAPDDGAIVAAADAPRGRYAVPSRNDCLACHEGAAVPVLGFSALQLSPDRDPLAPHADPPQSGRADLHSLVAQGKLVNLPPALLATPPRISATTPTARAALGYLHGNCGHCHNSAGALDGLDMVLAQLADPGADSVARTLESLLGHSSRFRPHGADRAQRIARDGTGSHMLTLRMRTDNPLARMPPLGVQVIDAEGVALIERWIANELKHQEKRPRNRQ
jgi:mono/diheme cytochrome c family protein